MMDLDSVQDDRQPPPLGSTESRFRENWHPLRRDSESELKRTRGSLSVEVIASGLLQRDEMQNSVNEVSEPQKQYKNSTS